MTDNAQPSRLASRPEHVVFIHGLWMTGFELEWLRREVARSGFVTHQFRYHSVVARPEASARRLWAYLAGIDADVVHLVGHSLGGIVLVHLFDQAPPQRPGRVLMLGTPLLGSTTASAFANRRWTRPLLGRSIQRGLLGDIPAWHGPREVGMIAGATGFGIGLLLFGELPAPHDGTVAVLETRGQFVTRHLTVSRSHFGMLFSRSVARVICNYLKSGDFGN